MKNQTNDIEERLLEYSVRIIKNDVLEETEELIKIFVTSTKTSEKKPRLGVIECSVLDVWFSFDLEGWTFPAMAGLSFVSFPFNPACGVVARPVGS